MDVLKSSIILSTAIMLSACGGETFAGTCLEFVVKYLPSLSGR